MMQEITQHCFSESPVGRNFDSNEPLDQICDDIENEDSLENVFKPFIGQCFLSEEEAHVFYSKYAEKNGFAIRKGRFHNVKGEKKRRDFCCHREGSPNIKFLDPSKQQRNRMPIRCECKAYLRITLKRSYDIFPEEWQVTSFNEEHNHELLAPELVRFLAPYRKISKEDEKRILLLKEGGLTVRQIIRVMELEKNVKHGKLPFLKKDISNLFGKMGQMHAGNDAMNLLKQCKCAKEENEKFQYVFTVDEDNRLENIFWSPPLCFDSYKLYGDVVVFDTTYKVNSYEMPFGVFVGVDNHGRTILLGFALLRNETTSSFRWLMKTFVKIMGREPKTILTDQDPWMTEAIAKEMPLTKHGFCIWHITTKFSGWFTSILRNRYQSWCSDFYKLYNIETPEEFESQWFSTLAKYNMVSNKHVKGLYAIKHFWVPAYLRDHFFGGMTTTGRSESINAFIKRFTSSHSSLCQLIAQVDIAIEDVRQTQLHDTMLETYRGSCLRTKSPLEEQAHKFLTPFAFKLFQKEFEWINQYKVVEESHLVFKVKHYKEVHAQEHKVISDGKFVVCSCKNFEFWGILCRHALSVFFRKYWFEIPMEYFLPRWCREKFQCVEEVTSCGGEEPLNVTQMNEDVGVVHCPPISKTKGRPKQKRMKGGKELAKQVKTCSFCKRVGHNITTCPEKENQTVPKTSRKRKASGDDGLNPIFALKC